MRYGEVCNAALQLYNQYSLAGETIPSTYNNQADYLRRMANLVDDAQMVIASGPRRIHAAKKLWAERGREEGPFLRYTLPEDLMEIIPGGLFTYRDGRPHPLPFDPMRYDSGFDRLDERHILLPRELARKEVWLEYYRRPRSVMACVNEGLMLCDVEVTVPTGATSILVAGHTETRKPGLKTLVGGEVTDVTLTVSTSQSLNGETGKLTELNAYRKRNYLVGTATVSGGDTVIVSGWAKPGDAVFAFYDGNTLISFEAAPTEPDEDMELDNSPDTHRPIPYYVAAYLIMQEDAFAYASLHNQWQNLLGSLYEQPQPKRAIVEDVYGGVLDFAGC